MAAINPDTLPTLSQREQDRAALAGAGRGLLGTVAAGADLLASPARALMGAANLGIRGVNAVLPNSLEIPRFPQGAIAPGGYYNAVAPAPVAAAPAAASSAAPAVPTSPWAAASGDTPEVSRAKEIERMNQSAKLVQSLPEYAPAPAPAPARAPTSGVNPFDSALAAEGVTGPKADFIRSIYQQESSSGANTRTSNAGATGGMQIIPSTFASVADKGWDINNPEHNARAGIRYAAQMHDAAGGDPALAAAGYYGGPGGMAKARLGVPVFDPRNPNAPSTLQYGQQVAARLLGPNQPQFREAEPGQAVAIIKNGVGTISTFGAMPTVPGTEQFAPGTKDQLAGAARLYGIGSHEFKQLLSQAHVNSALSGAVARQYGVTPEQAYFMQEGGSGMASEFGQMAPLQAEIGRTAGSITTAGMQAETMRREQDLALLRAREQIEATQQLHEQTPQALSPTSVVDPRTKMIVGQQENRGLISRSGQVTQLAPTAAEGRIAKPIVGKVYTDKQGNRAVYQIDGTYKPL